MALPSEDEQAELLKALAGLVRAAGPLPLLTSHLVEASPEFFPGAWTSTAEGMRFIALRFLALAGLGELDARVGVGQAIQKELPPIEATGLASRETRHAGAAAWFQGVEDGVCLFGVDESKLQDPVGALGAMAHEVAHAWRHVHKLAEDNEEEELHTDVTTVFLGFGILTTNGAYRYRSSTVPGGSQWSHQSQGYLAPESMAFLLAAQVQARAASAAEAQHIERQLEPNQAAAFASARKRLQRADSGLASRVDLPPIESLPAPPALQELFARVPEFIPPASALAAVTPIQQGKRRPNNRGRRTFRVRHTRAGSWLFLGLLIGGFAAIPVAHFLPIGSAIALGVVLFAAAGFVIGRRHYRFQCADRECEGALSSQDARCPECHAEVAGEIAKADDRLTANEALDGVLDDGGAPTQFPSLKPGHAARVFSALAVLCFIGLESFFAYDAWSRVFRNDVRVYFDPDAASVSVSVDGAPAREGKRSVEHLKLRMGTHSLAVSDSTGKQRTIEVKIAPGASYAARASRETCFAVLGALRFYRPPSAKSVDTIQQRVNQDAFELPSDFYFRDTIPDTIFMDDVGRMGVVYDCDCSDLYSSDKDLAARLISLH